MSGIALQETQELIANAGQPTLRALTVQGTGANGGMDPSMSYQSEMFAEMRTNNKLMRVMIKHLENLTGERYDVADIEDPTIQ